MKSISSNQFLLGSLVLGLGAGLYHYFSSRQQNKVELVLNDEEMKQLQKLLEVLEEKR